MSYGFLFTRLVASLLVEALSSVFHMVTFLFRRRAVREDMRAVILGRKASAAALLAAGLYLAVLPGCACEESRMGNSHPGSSFSRQVEEVKDSVYRIFEMKDWRESLRSDLVDIVSDDPCQLPETLEMWGW